MAERPSACAPRGFRAPPLPGGLDGSSSPAAAHRTNRGARRGRAFRASENETGSRSRLPLTKGHIMRTILTKSVLPLLVLGVTLLSANPARAQDRDDRWRVSVQAPAPPEVYFRHSPRWENIQGTRVYVVRDEDRPDYDMFRYGGSYYIYNDGYWYRGDRWNGPFVAIDFSSVPDEFRSVPRDEWVSYPSNWANDYDNGYNNNGYYNNNGRYYNNTRASVTVTTHHHHHKHNRMHQLFHHHHNDDND
jgi:hypothetical protein